MKFDCGKVAPRERIAAVGFAVLSAAASWRIGTHYGWDGSKPGLVDDVGDVFAFAGFLIAAFCVASVPLNRVNTARLAVGALFTSYAYLGALAAPGLTISDRVFNVLLCLSIAVVAAAALVRADVAKDIKDIEKDVEVKP